MSDKPFDLKRRITHLACICAICLLAACSTAPETVEREGPNIRQRLLTLPRPPILSANDEQEITFARLRYSKTEPARLNAQPAARRVAVDALPFLSRSPAGIAFLSAAGHRAIARGDPPQSCPMVAAATAPDTESAIGAALSSCLSQRSPAAEGCGCRVLAYDDILAVPREEMAYAGGTTARIRIPEVGLDSLAVAEDVNGDGILLRDLGGPLGVLAHLDGGRVAIDLYAPERIRFEGRSIPVGFRRGRIAERIYATDREGRQMSLLIGFSPEELAQRAGAWLSYQPSG